MAGSHARALPMPGTLRMGSGWMKWQMAPPSPATTHCPSGLRMSAATLASSLNRRGSAPLQSCHVTVPRHVPDASHHVIRHHTLETCRVVGSSVTRMLKHENANRADSGCVV